jgi:hypothetical protein
VRAVGDYGRMDPKMRKHSLQIDRTVFQLRPGGGRAELEAGSMCEVCGFASFQIAEVCCCCCSSLDRIEINSRQDRLSQVC